MPVYQCFVQEGSITEPIRAEVASEITRLQVEATDAPRQFVNVVFAVGAIHQQNESPSGRW
jgi:phenylpyruvate tautomerase PptA (4-oxalocrotonate tautomerase family)